MYLNIRNIKKFTHHSISAWATVLIGYIPVTKLDCFSRSKRKTQGQQIFHDCMKCLLGPLMDVGKSGANMPCADGFVHRVFPILAVYVADHPKQCLVACCQENCCPCCVVEAGKHGRPEFSTQWDPASTLEAMKDAAVGDTEALTDLGLQPNCLFWEDLPYCDIISCITPDLLHQLHKGVFKDHCKVGDKVSWGGSRWDWLKILCNAPQEQFMSLPKRYIADLPMDWYWVQEHGEGLPGCFIWSSGTRTDLCSPRNAQLYLLCALWVSHFGHSLETQWHLGCLSWKPSIFCWQGHMEKLQ